MKTHFSNPATDWGRVSRRHLLAGSKGKELSAAFDRYDPQARNADDLHEAILGQRGLFGVSMLAGGAVGTLGGLLALTALAPAVGVCLGVAGVGLFGYCVSKATMLMEKEELVKSTALSVVDDQIEPLPGPDGTVYRDRRELISDGYFHEVYQVRDRHGEVLSRHVELGAGTPVILDEDVGEGLVTIRKGDESKTYRARLELPSNGAEVLRISHGRTIQAVDEKGHSWLSFCNSNLHTNDYEAGPADISVFDIHGSSKGVPYDSARIDWAKPWLNGSDLQV